MLCSKCYNPSFAYNWSPKGIVTEDDFIEKAYELDSQNIDRGARDRNAYLTPEAIEYLVDHFEITPPPYHNTPGFLMKLHGWCIFNKEEVMF